MLVLAADLVPICICAIWRQMHRDTAPIFPDVPKCPHALLDDVHRLAHVSAFSRRAYSRYSLRYIHGGWRFPLGIPHLAAPDRSRVWMRNQGGFVQLVVAHPMVYFPLGSDHPLQSSHRLFV